MGVKNFFYRVNPNEVLAELTALRHEEWLQFLVDFFHDLRNDDPDKAKTQIAAGIIKEAHEFRAKRSNAGKESAKQRATNVEHMLTDVEHMLTDVATQDQQTSTRSSNSNSSSNNSSTEEKIKTPRKKKEVPDLKAKIVYAENVTMTPEEHAKLVAEHGEALTFACIAKLSNYKGANGKTYKSDYLAILSWVVDEVKKKFTKVEPKTFTDIRSEKIVEAMRDFVGEG